MREIVSALQLKDWRMIRTKKLMQSIRFFPLQLLLDGKMRKRRVRPQRYEAGKIIHYKYNTKLSIDVC